jgi:diaminopimelate epimerase
MLLGNADGYDFSMTYYNADGKEGTMCGNGGRCLTQYAFDKGIKKDIYTFIAIDGPHESKIDQNGWVHLKMSDVKAVEKNIEGDVTFYVLDTGSPHYVEMVDNVNSVDVVALGQMIRYNERFKQVGINVNFVAQEENQLFVRTYERGVENETFSCGTGVTASALIAGIDKLGAQTIQIETLGGKLAVSFNNRGDNAFDDIWLMGPGTFVFNGSMDI